jgi:endonuclease-3
MKRTPHGPAYADLLPLLDLYRLRKHPLEYQNRYQLVVMVVLSSRSTDVAVNRLAPAFFAAYPSIEHLAVARPEDLHPYIKSIPGFVKKSVYLVRMAKAVGTDAGIPTMMEGLTALAGIGRKSANVIIRESGGVAEGIIVDLHVLRVVPRIGLTPETDAEKMEQALMTFIPSDQWHAAGMAFSFLGREVCRPTDPNCEVCVMQHACRYRREVKKQQQP